jgi:hypothetical protein
MIGVANSSREAADMMMLRNGFGNDSLNSSIDSRKQNLQLTDHKINP